jgi:hypothetical protein
MLWLMDNCGFDECGASLLLITGIDSRKVLDQDVQIATAFQPLAGPPCRGLGSSKRQWPQLGAET